MAKQPQIYLTKILNIFVAGLYGTVNGVCGMPHHPDANSLELGWGLPQS